jgi:uncharacterized repeat protein (TIGR01451 family)
VQKQSYDFELWINPGSPLSVGNGHIHIDSLSAGDIRKENFTIYAPATVGNGEVYVINFRAQSYPDPAPFWGRLGESPDNVFDTTLKADNAMKVQVVTQPLLIVSSFTLSSSNPTVGDSVTATAVIENRGTAEVVNVKATLQLPPSFSLSGDEPSQLLGNIPTGKPVPVKWTFVPQSAGSYSLFLQVSSSNQQPVTGSQSITVSPSLLGQITTSGSLITIVFVVVVLFLIFMIFKRMQS